jgi:cytochrome c-type biogenesis protein CcmH/NrfG
LYDPATDSSLTLLRAPADPVAYYQKGLRAIALVAANSIVEAEPIAEELVRDYPRDRENWVILARVKYRLQKYSEAVPAFRNAGEILGWGPFAIPGWNIALSQYLGGNRKAALAEMRREVFERGGVLRRGP